MTSLPELETWRAIDPGPELVLIVTCPHHNEDLTAWRATAGTGNVPIVSGAYADSVVFWDVVPPSEWDDAVATWEATMKLRILNLGNLQRGRDEVSRHLQITLRCPRASCTLDASFSSDTRKRITEGVKARFAAGERGVVRLTTVQMGW